MARLSDPGVGEDNRIVVVKHLPRTPQMPPVCSSPDSMETSPYGLQCSDEKENMRHSLSGRFPSVSLFKQYQNAAMAVIASSLCFAIILVLNALFACLSLRCNWEIWMWKVDECSLSGIKVDSFTC